MILDDAATPSIYGGLIHIGYCEAVDGYRHAYRVIERVKVWGGAEDRKVVKYSRTADHPADEACPGCADKGLPRG